MPVIHRADARRTATPNAVMTTLASPSQGGAARSVWRVDMEPGAGGPAHTFDAEQIWTLIAGSATLELAGERLALGAGDTVVLPAAAPRRIATDDGCAAIVTAPAGARAQLADGTDRGVPAWIA
jgi:quercetin dioxygenase-like cupin family protein